MSVRIAIFRFLLFLSALLAFTNVLALEVSPTSVEIIAGNTAKLKVSNSSGTVTTVSSNATVASVSYASGIATVKGIKAGKVTITVKDRRASKKVEVTVKSAPLLTVSPTSITMNAGSTFSITVSNASGTVTVVSSKTSVATASYAGSNVTVKGIATGSATLTIKDSKTTLTVPVTVNSTTPLPPPSAGNYTLLAWNDLGMHCMDGMDFSVFSILPPYNTLHAQLKNKSGALVTSGVSLTYEAVRNEIGANNVGTGRLNSYSTKLGTDKPKTNFWDNSGKLFGLNPVPEIGLNLDGLANGTPDPGNPSPSMAPAPMPYNAEYKWYEAEGIPVTPFADEKDVNGYIKDFYPTVRVVAKDTSGNVLATATTVLPVSDEMTCKGCHASTTTTNPAQIAAKPSTGWVNDANPEKDWKRNILKLHDERKLVLPIYQQALSILNSHNSGYKTTGLLPTADSGQPVLCVGCHASNAYFDKRNKKSVMNGLVDNTGNRLAIRPFTQVLHDKHAGVIDPATAQTLNSSSNRTACYTCHPGSKTQCLRGVMGKAKTANGDSLMSCQSCHGNMKAVGNSARQGWIDEPTCESCHNSGATNRRDISGVGDATNGKPIVPADRTFATNADKPAILGLHPNLYRFSTGHGGLQCEACHGSTHAEYPSLHSDDNTQSIAVQGHSGTVAECNACHTTVPTTVNGGPHGMHTTGNAWVSAHQDAAEHGGTSSCTYCHGTTSAGTPLSAIKVAKTINAGEFGTKNWPAGYQVSCFSCHNGPNPD